MSSHDAHDVATHIGVAEGIRGLAGQEATVDQLRTRGVRLVTLGVAVATALGFTDDDRHWWATAVGLASLAVVVGVVVWIEWPREWKFHLSPKTLLSDEWLPDGETAVDYRHSYACELDTVHTENEVPIRRAFRAYRIGLIALAVEAAALVVTA